MKKFLSRFYQTTAIGLALICGFAALPINSLAISSSQSASPPLTPLQSDETPIDDPDDADDSDLAPTEPDLDPPQHEFTSDLIITVVNPGYGQTITNPDGTTKKLSDVGELIVLQNLTDAPLSLAGYSLHTTNSSGTDSLLYTFPEGSYMVGKILLLRYRSSPDYAAADINYRTSITQTGTLTLFFEDEPVDAVCWLDEDEETGCYRAFKNTTKTPPSVLVRNLINGSFEHVLVEDYEAPTYDPDVINFVIPEPDPSDDSDDPEDEVSSSTTLAEPKCRGLEITELLTYYVTDKSEQFIELFNPTADNIDTTDCSISYKNKTYPLTGTVTSGGYYAFYNSELFSLTKNPTNPSIVTLVDADGEPIDEVAYPNGQKKSTSYAKIFDSTGAESWQITYAITPGVENVYQKFRSCEEGKVINEATGNCVKVTSVSTALAECPAGQYRNPLTNRCKSIESTTSTLKECAEGYERNPETNRCRKITTTNDGADYALAPAATTTTGQTIFIGIGIVIIIVLLGIVYIILQFRHEIARAFRKARQRLNHIREHLLTRAVRRHRDKES